MAFAHPEELRPLLRPSRWQAVLALIAIGVADALLPQRLRFGPPWLVLSVVGPLAVSIAFAHRRGLHDLAHKLSVGSVVVVSVVITINAVLLVARLPNSKSPGSDLLRDAALIWGVNVFVFALWYWEIDAGGPGRRHMGRYRSDDFVFPQFQQDPEHAGERWMPDFLDYLFLAFNTSTAFSPTDTLILSRRAKAMCMAQASVSLITIGVLAARAINTL
jgi:hypothetical protein